MTRTPAADVTIYSPLAGVLYARDGRPSGGAELQAYHLARALARAGLRVRHAVVMNREPPDVWPGLEVVPLDTSYFRGGISRRRAILAGLGAARARLYIQRSAGFETAMVGAWARAHGSQFVFSSSSTADFCRDPQVARQAGTSLDEWPSRFQYHLGLRLARAVVVQTEDQNALVRRNFGIEARLIRSFAEVAAVRDTQRDAFVWIGGLVEIKDPLSYLELARRVPEARFVLVAADRGPSWMQLARTVAETAAALPNVELLPPRGRQDVLGLYARAVAVVNTSRLEGFPNTFLEGWGRGIPALSLRVDPDRTIARNPRLGRVAEGSMDRFAAAAREQWQERDDASGAEAIRSYVREMHHPDVVGPLWESLVRQLIER